MLLGNLTVSQGTKVLEDREVRHRFSYATEDVLEQQITQKVSKYTGASGAPEWMDTEPGSVLNLNDFVRVTQVRQASLRRCAI